MGWHDDDDETNPDLQQARRPAPHPGQQQPGYPQQPGRANPQYPPNPTPSGGFPQQPYPNPTPSGGFPQQQVPNPTGGFQQQVPNQTGGFRQQVPNATPSGGFPQVNPTGGYPQQQGPNPTGGYPQQGYGPNTGGFPQQTGPPPQSPSQVQKLAAPIVAVEEDAKASRVVYGLSGTAVGGVAGVVLGVLNTKLEGLTITQGTDFIFMCAIWFSFFVGVMCFLFPDRFAYAVMRWTNDDDDDVVPPPPT